MTKPANTFALPAAVQMDTTALKKSMGQLRRSLQDKVIEVTKHGKREAVILAPDQYDKLTALAGASHLAVAELEAQYDAIIAGMQTKEHDQAMDRLKSVSGNDLRAFLAGHYAQNPLPPVAPAQQPAAGASAIHLARKRTRVASGKAAPSASRDAKTGKPGMAKAANAAVKKAKT